MTRNLVLDKSGNDALNAPESSKSKGARLKRVRLLANLTREQFCEDSDINLASLISWEVGRFGGLSEKGAKKVISRVAQEGVFCTLDWLLYEIGAGPEVRVDYKKANQPTEGFNPKQVIHSLDNTSIIEELLLFRKLHPQSIDFVVEDDAMLPHYEVGDYIAGIKRPKEQIKSLIGKDCIAQLKNGHLTFRRLQAGPHEHSFNLVPVNLQTNVKDSVIYDVEVAFAAPVIWHRKNDPR